MADGPEIGHARGGRYASNTRGDHFVCELSGCNTRTLNDMEAVKRALHDAASKAGATVLDGYFHRFDPVGVSGLLCLSESHLSIHTWPEARYAAVDIYTCGDTVNPAHAISALAAAFEAKQSFLTRLDRGQEPAGDGIFTHQVLPLGNGQLPHKSRSETDPDAK